MYQLVYLKQTIEGGTIERSVEETADEELNLVQKLKGMLPYFLQNQNISWIEADRDRVTYGVKPQKAGDAPVYRTYLVEESN